MDFIETIKGIMLKPRQFFSQTRVEIGLSKALTFFAIAMAVNVIATAIIAIMATNIMMAPLIGAVLAYIGSFIGLFIGAGILFVLAYIVGGRATFKQTLRLTTYLSVFSLFSWIPLVGFIFGIWALVATIIGVSAVHEISILKSILAVIVIPALLIILVGFLLMAMFASMFASVLEGLLGGAALEGVMGGLAV